jgi:hypothetical protein
VLVVVACASESAEGGKDVKMLHFLVFNSILYLSKGIVKMVLSPPSIALGLNSPRLAILHLFSLDLRARC